MNTRCATILKRIADQVVTFLVHEPDLLTDQGLTDLRLLDDAGYVELSCWNARPEEDQLFSPARNKKQWNIEEIHSQAVTHKKDGWFDGLNHEQMFERGSQCMTPSVRANNDGRKWLAETMLQTSATETEESLPDENRKLDPAPSPFCFRKQEDDWLIRYEGNEKRVKHLKGLSDIAFLLSQPYVGIRAVMICLHEAPPSSAQTVPATAAHHDRLTETTSLSTALEGPDLEAIKVYRLEARKLAGERGQAKERGDDDAVARIDVDIERLVSEAKKTRVSRDKKAANATSNRIRRAIGRIREHLPLCANHLDESISLGATLIYRPPKDIPWEI